MHAAEAERTRRAGRPATGAGAEGDPARLYATVAGAGLVLLGVIGFFYEPSFAAGGDVASDEAFGLFAVNGWQNLLHIAIGLLGLAAAGGAARRYALAAGLGNTLFALWGFLAGDAILGLFAVNAALNVLHLLLGLTGLAAGAASPADPPARARRPARGDRPPRREGPTRQPSRRS